MTISKCMMHKEMVGMRDLFYFEYIEIMSCVYLIDFVFL